MKQTLFFLSIVSVFLTVRPLVASEPLIFSTFQSASVADDLSEAVLREAYKRIGLQIVVKKFPAKRALLMANNGRTDGELFRIIGTEKHCPNLIRIPVPIIFFKGSVFTKNTDFPVKGWDSLKPYKIGIVRGIQFSDAPTKQMKRYDFNLIEELFKSLDKGLIDIALYAHLDGLVFIKNHFKGSGMRVLEPPLVELPLYNYLHKKHKKLVPKITSVLQKMEQEGMIQKIVQETEAKILQK
ncbi:substrate-binding periplasmic protein [Desulfonema magnum]|uniref:Solute-binding protein family 3 domain-containing protein, MltF-like n=1 Tax=Desulfonema magnum TaxID=45655 RepID=A0A975GTK6_9BACT|nr:transporter substrate-binding domain-containing protein [Desulfonema magnum]QTA93179.1 Solute-binding protein family 3 domain-containing protein, MltF-like [Desulfonema magnum]